MGAESASGGRCSSPSAAAALPTLLVFMQPDIGTALVYGAILAAALFFAGARWRHLAILATIAVLLGTIVLWLAPTLGVDILAPYQRARITAFLHPSDNPQGAAYNINQSITAVGSGDRPGGVWPARPRRTSTTCPSTTPTSSSRRSPNSAASRVRRSCSLLYLLLIWRGVRVIATASDPFSATAAGAIVFALLFQIFVNVGMTIGIAPITGIPLPFVSVGGSAMVTNLLAIGVLQAIAIRRR